MKFHEISKCDLTNGDGIGVVLWVSGCRHFCPHCQNPVTWDPEDGLPFDEEAMAEMYEALSPSYISRLTLSGGDPLFPSNRQTISEIVGIVKVCFPQKKVWCYTGYVYEDLLVEAETDKNLRCILENVDYLVDGPYVEELRSIPFPYRGSTNQRIINLPETREKGVIVEWT